MLATAGQVVIGIGFPRETPADVLERSISEVLLGQGLALSDVAALATIDRKRGEAGLADFAARHGLLVTYYSAAQLASVRDLERPSEHVREHVGTPGVAEPAARLLACTETLLVAKQVYRDPRSGLSVTVAVARAPEGAVP